MTSLTIKKYFGSKAFYRRALLLALPVMFQQLVQSLVSLIDNFMVAELGDVKMSGVNVAGQVLFVFIVLLNAVCASGGIFLTQYSGAKDAEGMRQAVKFKTVVIAFAIIAYFIVCFIFPETFLSLMLAGNTQAEAILEHAVTYMRLMGLIGVPMAVSTIIASSFREIGEVKAPLVISITATLVNTFFNWVLIYGNLGAARLEVAGAAIATIIARTVEMLLYIILLLRRKPEFMVRLKDILKIDFALFRAILKKSGMIMFSEMVWVLSETVCTALYNGRGGADVVSGMSASFAIANLFFVSFGGITTATGIILGQTLGQGKLDEARKQKRWLLTAAFLFGCFMLFIALLTMLLIPVVFGNLSEGSQHICRQMVLMMALFMPLWVFNNAQFAVSRAGGDTEMGLWVDGVATIGVVIPGMLLMAYLTDMGPVTMYTLIKAVDILKICIAWWWLKKERWVRNLAEK